MWFIIRDRKITLYVTSFFETTQVNILVLLKFLLHITHLLHIFFENILFCCCLFQKYFFKGII